MTHYIGGPGQNVQILPTDYQVESILQKKFIDGQTKYLIKWKDYDHSQCTWEPRSNLQDIQELLEEFEEKYALQLKQPTIQKNNLKISKKKIEKKRLQQQQQQQKQKQVQQKAQQQQQQQKPQPPTELQPKSNNQTSSQPTEPIKEKSNRLILKHGKLEKGDIPSKIKAAQKLLGKVMFLVEWKQNQGEQQQLMPSMVESDELRINFPQIIIDYYEQHIEFQN